MDNTRRSFIRNAGVAVTAAVAGTAAAAADPAADARHRLALLEDTNAITVLQQRWFALMQQHNTAALGTLFAGEVPPVHAGDLLDARIDGSSVAVAPDRRSAAATVRARVLLGTPVSGDGTLQQMARLQGQTERQWSESGVYTAQYVKLDTEWKLQSLQYRKT